jgi:hypothetical protein
MQKQNSGASLIDMDAGEDWGTETIPLVRPFRFMGIDYLEATLRVPNGADVELHLVGRDALAEIRGLAVALTGWPDVVFQRMHAGDRARIMNRVGEHIAGVR